MDRTSTAPQRRRPTISGWAVILFVVVLAVGLVLGFHLGGFELPALGGRASLDLVLVWTQLVGLALAAGGLLVCGLGSAIEFLLEVQLTEPSVLSVRRPPALARVPGGVWVGLRPPITFS